MSDSVLALPTSSNTSYAASSLLVQAYIAPHLPGLQVEQGSEVSCIVMQAIKTSGQGSDKVQYLQISCITDVYLIMYRIAQLENLIC